MMMSEGGKEGEPEALCNDFHLASEDCQRHPPLGTHFKTQAPPLRALVLSAV
jgi:hypothetical protein